MLSRSGTRLLRASPCCHGVLKPSSKSLCKSVSLPSQERQNLIYKSSVPTYHFQSRIPQLPLPRLQDTCDRYLLSLKTVTSEDRYSKSVRLVTEFKEGIGKELQADLQAQVTEDPKLNYVSRYWNDMYLKSRYPLMHNFNVFIGITNESREGYEHPVIRATNFTVALCNFMRALQEQKLEPYGVLSKPNKVNKSMLRYLAAAHHNDKTDLKTVVPLCMSQFNNIFKSTRIPENERDILQVFPDARHIIVFRNGNFYAVDVLEQNGDTKPAEEILADLFYIYEDKPRRPDCPLPVLTAGDRDNWKSARDKLIADGNEEALNMIDGAIYVVAMDEDDYLDEDATAKGFLQGNGFNRWFDKPLTLVFTESGKAALHMEHAWGDGMTILYPIICAYAETISSPAVGPTTVPTIRDSGSEVKNIEFYISKEVESIINNTKCWFDQEASRVNFQYFLFDKFGASFIKSQKMSPDSFIQLGFQLAFYRLYGYCPSTYESCSTATFRQGRTETMRPATLATKKVCEMISSQTEPYQGDFRAAVEECSKLHGKLAMEAAMGQGFDRHLFALRNLAAEKGLPMPGIFTDPSYALMGNYVISTSTVGQSAAISLGAFAPVAADGYGIGYSVLKNKIRGSITSYETRDCQGFVDSLNQTLEDMAKLLQKK